MNIPHFQSTIERARCEIMADVLAGIVPYDVSGFADLHDYTDANAYGGAFELWCEDEGDLSVDEYCVFLGRVQNDLDSWIRGGGLKLPARIEHVVRTWHQWSPREQELMVAVVEDVLQHCRDGLGNGFIQAWCRNVMMPALAKTCDTAEHPKTIRRAQRKS